METNGWMQKDGRQRESAMQSAHDLWLHSLALNTTLADY